MTSAPEFLVEVIGAWTSITIVAARD